MSRTFPQMNWVPLVITPSSLVTVVEACKGAGISDTLVFERLFVTRHTAHPTTLNSMGLSRQPVVLFVYLWPWKAAHSTTSNTIELSKKRSIPGWVRIVVLVFSELIGVLHGLPGFDVCLVPGFWALGCDKAERLMTPSFSNQMCGKWLDNEFSLILLIFEGI